MGLVLKLVSKLFALLGWYCRWGTGGGCELLLLLLLLSLSLLAENCVELLSCELWSLGVIWELSSLDSTVLIWSLEREGGAILGRDGAGDEHSDSRDPDGDFLLALCFLGLLEL